MDVSWTAGSCDTTAPESTASAKNADDSTYTFGDWTKQNVTVTLAATDAGSGVKEIRYTTNGTDPTASTGTVYGTPFTINTEGTTTIKWRAIDNAGNVEAVRSAAVRIDKTAPSVSCGSADGAWHASDVSIACTAADTSGSGVAPASDESFSLSTNVPAGTETSNAQTNSRTISDAAGNTTTAGPVGGNKVDKKGPQVSCDAADGAWHSADVSIACTATDGGSGVNPETDENFSLHTDVTAGTETSNASTNSRTISDAVGNTSTAGPVGGNKVDKKGPQVSCDAADGAWHATDVSIACTATDGGSGVIVRGRGFSLHTDVTAGTETDDASTNSRTISDARRQHRDGGPGGRQQGRQEGPAGLLRPGRRDWHAADVSIDCTATDGGSGVDPATDESFSLHTDVPAGTETDDAETDSRTISDAVGNTATAGPVGGNKVDKKGPSVSCDAADGAWHATDVSIACTASDGGSGLAAASPRELQPVRRDVPAGTETSNASTDSRTVSDAVGNTATAGPVAGNKVDKKGPGCRATRRTVRGTRRT